MVFDASTVFVLALTIGIVVVLAWVEVHSRRQQKPDTSSGGAVAAPPLHPSRGKAVSSKQ